MDEKLASLLSSPEVMGQVMNIVKSLSSQSDTNSDPPSVTANATPDTSESNQASQVSEKKAGQEAGEYSLLSKIDPRLISSAMNAFGEYSKDDEGVKLVKSLKAHLGGEYSGRVDQAVEALRLSRSVRSALHSIKGGG